jgi:hypothetical protein
MSRPAEDSGNGGDAATRPTDADHPLDAAATDAANRMDGGADTRSTEVDATADAGVGDPLVLSVRQKTVTLVGANADSAVVTLDVPVNVAQTVPFVSLLTENPTANRDMFVDVHLLNGSELSVTRQGARNGVEVRITLVEFGPRVSVQSGEFELSPGTAFAERTPTNAIDPHKAFLVFWYSSSSNSLHRHNAAVRGRIGADDLDVNFSRFAGTAGGQVSGHWWVVESDAFQVRRYESVDMAGTREVIATGVSSDFFTLHSYEVRNTGDTAAQTLVDCLTFAGQIECVRGASGVPIRLEVQSVQVLGTTEVTDATLDFSPTAKTSGISLGNFGARAMVNPGSIGVPGASSTTSDEFGIGLVATELDQGIAPRGFRGKTGAEAQQYVSVVDWGDHP